MKTFVIVLAIDEDAAPDWAAAEEAFAKLNDPNIEPDAVECLWAALSDPPTPQVRSCVAGGSRLYVVAGQEWADDSRVLDYIGVLLGTGVLEAAGFQVLVAS